jgi:hypothetical protein
MRVLRRVNVSKLYGLKKEEIISMIHSQQQHLFFSCENQFLLPRRGVIVYWQYFPMQLVLNAAAYLSSAGVEAPVALMYL